MNSEDLSYFRARAAEERKRASAAASAPIRSAHLEFASRYDEMAGRLHTDAELQSSRDAVHRSLELLKTTVEAVRNR